MEVNKENVDELFEVITYSQGTPKSPVVFPEHHLPPNPSAIILPIVKTLKEYKLEIVVFMGGMIIMILEIIGSRILAPYLGTSIFVWTSLIGIIMASLSLGYWYGGRLADKNSSLKTLSLIFFLAGISVFLLVILQSLLLDFITTAFSDVRSGSIVAATILFVPPSVLLGMVSPYSIRLKMKKISESGETVGNLFAISTVGSIFGTFLAGFYLISYFGTTKILLLLAVMLILTSIFISFDSKKKEKVLILILALSSLLIHKEIVKTREELGVFDIDTKYTRVKIYDSIDKNSQRPARFMVLGNTYDSAIFLDGAGFVFNYLKYSKLIPHFNPNFKNTLMIGGAAYTYPMYYLQEYPNAYIDVVEIDSMLTELAKKHFGLEDHPRLTVYHEDGRTYLNRNKKKYDVIFMDAFKSYSPPFQLATKEAAIEMYESLEDGGIVMSNIISPITGNESTMMQAVYLTYKEVFPHVYIIPTRSLKGSEVQNILLIASKSKEVTSFTSSDEELNNYLENIWTQPIPNNVPVLTDEYAPVERYVMAFL